MKRSLCIAIISFITISTLLTGCHGNYELGKILDVEITNDDQFAASNTPSPQFCPQQDTLGYSYDMTTIGRAKLMLPYPKGWTMSKTTDYDICFTAPADDKHLPNTNIYFHSTLEMVDVSDAKQLMDFFTGPIQNDKYTLEGHSVYMRPSSTVEKHVVNTKISKPELNLQLTYRDWNANVQGLNISSENAAYFQRTIFSWYDTPCLLTGLVSDKNAEKLNDLLLYMMSNSQYINEGIQKTQRVSINSSTSKITFPICSYYQERAASSGDIFDSATLFFCPPDSGTGHSHSSVAVYAIDQEDFHKIEQESFDAVYLDLFLKNHFDVTSADYDVYGFLDQTMNSSINFGKASAKEYVYRFMWGPMEAGDLDGCFSNQEWILGLYPVLHENTIYLFVLTTPSSGLIWSMDNIELISRYITFEKK